MSDNILFQRQFAPRPVMDLLAFSKPAFFKIAPYAGQIRDTFREKFKYPGSRNNFIHRIAIRFIITGKVKDAVTFQHPVQLAGEITAQQPVAAMPVFRPGVGAEDVNPFQRGIRQHLSDKKTCFHPENIHVFYFVALHFTDDFA